MKQRDLKNCGFCRFMRGVAFGGLGALMGGYGALLLGLPRNEAIYYATFGAIVLTAIISRKRPTKKD
jgi:hypothetical protein